MAMLMSVLCISVSAEESTELTSAEKSEIMLRRVDADGNGSYSIADAQELLRAAAGTAANKASYDVNSDGVTSLEDAIAVLKQVSGIGNVLTDDQAVELFNAKLNNVKNREKGLPGFEKTTTATCQSIKITQDVQATGLASLVAGQLACKDLEYDKYVEKMVGLMGSSNLDEETKESIEAMKQSAEEYRKPQTEKVTGVAGDYVDHFLDFPRDAMNTASEITKADISSLSYTMKDGNIIFTLRLPNKTYTNHTTYKANSYAKVMNVVEYDEDDGSTLKRVDLKNGTVVFAFDYKTGAMKYSNYAYSYYSEIAAPPQVQSDASFGDVKIQMTTKTTASYSENVVF